MLTDFMNNVVGEKTESSGFMSWSLILVYLLLAGLFRVVLNFIRDYQKTKHIPGPNPFIPPNIFAGVDVPISYFQDITKTYSKVFCYWPAWIFSAPLIFVADIKAVRQVLTDVKTFTKGPDYTVRFAAALGKGMVTTVGDEHKRQRACVLRFFQKKKIDTYIPVFYAKTIQSMQDCTLLTTLKDGSIVVNPDVKENFDIDLWVHLITLRVISQIVAGYDSSIEPDYERKAMADIIFGQTVVVNRIFFKLPIFNADPSIIKLKRSLDEMYSRVNHAVDERNKLYRGCDSTKDKEPDDILRALLDSGCSKQEMQEQITTIVSAGFETTATFLSYALYRIAKFPEVQERIRAEMNEVIGNRTNITAEDLSNLKYLTCVLKESMRYTSIVGVITRLTTKDVTLTLADGSKQIIPKGTDLLVPFFLLNMDSDIWDEPKKFIPERMDKLKDLQSVRHGYLPFSYGIRSCVGNLFAFVEGQLAVVCLLKHFKLEVVQGFRPRATSGISTILLNGMRLRLVPILKSDN